MINMQYIIIYTEFQFYRKKYHKNIERKMDIVNAIFNRIPNIFWNNMAKTLMQEICDSTINSLDSSDTCKQRHTKTVILFIFENFISKNFSDTDMLSQFFKPYFLNNTMNIINSLMNEYFKPDYINLLILKRILDTDDNIGDDGSKIFLNILQKPIAEIQKTKVNDSPKSKATEFIKLIKDQLKPIPIESPPNEPTANISGGSIATNKDNTAIRDIHKSIKLLNELKIQFPNNRQFDSITSLLQNAIKTIDSSNAPKRRHFQKIGGDEPNEDLGSKFVSNLGNKTISDAAKQAQSQSMGALSDMANNAQSQGMGALSDMANNVQSQGMGALSDITNKAQGLSALADAANQMNKMDPTAIISGKGQEMLGNAVGDMQKNIPLAQALPIGQALGNMQNNPLQALPLDKALGGFPLGANLPTPDELSAKIVAELFKNFSETDGKGYVEIRNDIYTRFLDSMNTILSSPEGRQMHLRIIDPFLTNCIDNVIDSGEIAAAFIIHMISNIYEITSLVETEVANYFEMFEQNKLTGGLGITDPLEGYQFTKSVVLAIQTKVTDLLTTHSPLNKLYKDMDILGYDQQIISQKQSRDYKKTLCYKYDNESSVSLTKPSAPPLIINTPKPEPSAPPMTNSETDTNNTEPEQSESPQQGGMFNKGYLLEHEDVKNKTIKKYTNRKLHNKTKYTKK
jgi:hypothetical protein